MSFTGKVVLVTGASSGIGRAVAEAFAKRGAHLAITGRDETNLNNVKDNCKENGDGEVLPILVDFFDIAALEHVVPKVVEKFKRLDILINNAGTIKIGNLMTSTVEDFDFHFTVNVKAMFILSKSAMPYLEASHGNIVNVSSIAGPRVLDSVLMYGMSKAAVDYFTKSTAKECAPKNVRVNSVNPSVVRTNIGRLFGGTPEQEEAFYEQMSQNHPIGRLGTVEEVASAILFLASEESAWTTGNCFLIDGGRSLVTN